MQPGLKVNFERFEIENARIGLTEDSLAIRDCHIHLHLKVLVVVS